MTQPVKKTKHNLIVCDMWERSQEVTSIYSYYSKPSDKKVRIFTMLDIERRGKKEHSLARMCGSGYIFTYMYKYVSEIDGKLYLRRISKSSTEDIELIQE